MRAREYQSARSVSWNLLSLFFRERERKSERQNQLECVSLILRVFTSECEITENWFKGLGRSEDKEYVGGKIGPREREDIKGLLGRRNKRGGRMANV